MIYTCMLSKRDKCKTIGLYSTYEDSYASNSPRMNTFFIIFGSFNVRSGYFQSESLSINNQPQGYFIYAVGETKKKAEK